MRTIVHEQGLSYVLCIKINGFKVMLAGRMGRGVLWALGFVCVSTVTLCLWAVNTTLQVEPQQSAAFSSAQHAPSLVKGQAVKVLNWNVQFMAGNANNQFFFDDGSDDWPAEAVLLSTIEAVAKLVESEDPDVILLQEVDDGAGRTYFQDQLGLLLERLPNTYLAQANAFYWQADFLPLPALWGPVGMKLSIISKYKIVAAQRYALAAISSQNWIERQFQPRRAILHVELESADGRSFHVLNTHFSAFAQGTDTMSKQVEQVIDLMEGFEVRGEQAVIGGDFNLIPSKAAYENLAASDQLYYNPRESELKSMLERFESVPSWADMKGAQSAEWHTHSSNHNVDKTPSKTLDYFFMTRGVKATDSRVRDDKLALPISDHMPVIARFIRE